MNNTTTNHIHWSFWLISSLTLLWNVGGSANYLMQTNMEFVSTLPETHRAIIIGRPVWATGGFAVGVFGGAIGCILLLFRKSIASRVLVASLLGVIVTMLHTVNVATSKINFSAAESFVMILLPLIVAIFLVWYSSMSKRKSWIS